VLVHCCGVVVSCALDVACVRRVVGGIADALCDFVTVSDTAKAREVVLQALEVVLGYEKQQLQQNFSSTAALTDGIDCSSVQSMLKSAYGPLVSGTMSAHVRQSLTGHVVLNPLQTLPVSSLVSIRTYHTVADALLSSSEASSEELLCCVDLLEAGTAAAAKLCDTIRSTYSFVPLVAHSDAESLLLTQAAKSRGLCVTALLRLGQTIGANAVLSHDTLDIASVRTSMFILKHCEMIVQRAANGSHSVDAILSDGQRWLSLCDAYELVGKAVMAGLPKSILASGCDVYHGWRWHVGVSGRQTPLSSVHSTSVPVSEVSQPITDDGRGDTTAVITPKDVVDFSHASPCEAVLPMLIHAKLCANEAKACGSKASELVLAHAGLGHGLAGLRATKPSALSAVRSARASRVAVRAQNDACNALRAGAKSREKALRKLQRVVMATECRDVFGEDVDAENSETSDTSASLDVSDVHMIL
jgi:hypothetical protein